MEFIKNIVPEKTILKSIKIGYFPVGQGTDKVIRTVEDDGGYHDCHPERNPPPTLQNNLHYIDGGMSGRLPGFKRLEELVKKHFDLRPGAIIRDLGLKRPIYRQLAAYGHFGRTDLDLPWEKTDKAAILRKEAGL